MKLKFFLCIIVATSCHKQLAMDNGYYNTPDYVPYTQYIGYDNNQEFVQPQYPVYEYPVQQNNQCSYSSAENAVSPAYEYHVTPASEKITKKAKAIKPRQRNVRPAEDFDWTSYWNETSKKNNTNENENETITTITDTTNQFPIQRSFSINALINNPKPRKRTQARREKSPATAFIMKKKFSISCCDLIITNFYDLKKHIKEKHRTTDGHYESVYKKENQYSYTTPALAASKVASLAVPGFFDCPYKDCGLELTSLVSLRNHYKRNHDNQKLNNK